MMRTPNLRPAWREERARLEADKLARRSEEGFQLGLTCGLVLGVVLGVVGFVLGLAQAGALGW